MLRCPGIKGEAQTITHLPGTHQQETTGHPDPTTIVPYRTGTCIFFCSSISPGATCKVPYPSPFPLLLFLVSSFYTTPFRLVFSRGTGLFCYKAT